MGLKNEVDALYLAQLESGNIRYTVQPLVAPTAVVSDGVVAAWAWAPYVQICAAAAVANPCWLCGVVIHTAAVEIHNGDIAIASGALAAEVDLAILGYAGVVAIVGATAALIANAQPVTIASSTIWLPLPIKIIGAPRLAGRVRKSTAASAAGVSLKVILAQAVGT